MVNSHTDWKDTIFQHLVDDSIIFFLIMTRDGAIIQAGAFAENTVGRSLTHVKFSDIIVDFEHVADMDKLVKSPDTRHLLNVITHNGLPQTFYFHFKAIGNHILAFGNMDAAELETMRHQLLTLNNELSNLTRQLHKTNAQLKNLNEQKNQFLGMAAHDMHHPLGVIQMYGEFLLEEAAEKLDVEHQTFLELIHASSCNMQQILNDFLDISQIEAGRLNLQLEHADLAADVKKNVDINRVLAAGKKIDIRFQCENKPLMATYDPGKIQQALNNLISNAIKYSDADTTISVKLLVSDSEAIISVTDTGMGIAESDINRLFKPFERVKTAKPIAEKSSGLGLAITQKIVKRHHGRIWVTSRLGHGSTFFVSLPISDKANDPLVTGANL